MEATPLVMQRGVRGMDFDKLCVSLSAGKIFCVSITSKVATSNMSQRERQREREKGNVGKMNSSRSRGALMEG